MTFREQAIRLARSVMPSNAFSSLQQRFGISPRVQRKLVARYGRVVQHGPFAGTLYVDQAFYSAYLPKLVGCYEDELHSVLECVIATDYKVLLDIGCAEGYYAVGLARRMPNKKVYAFDIDPKARALCEQMAQLNAVTDRVLVLGGCDTAALSKMPLKDSFLLCDIEGYELELLHPDLVPGLAGTDMLVELHECFYAGLTSTLLARFEATHDITLINTREVDPSRYPALDDIRHRDRRPAVSEGRPRGMQWAFMKARREIGT